MHIKKWVGIPRLVPICLVIAASYTGMTSELSAKPNRQNAEIAKAMRRVLSLPDRRPFAFLSASGNMQIHQELYKDPNFRFLLAHSEAAVPIMLSDLNGAGRQDAWKHQVYYMVFAKAKDKRTIGNIASYIEMHPISSPALAKEGAFGEAVYALHEMMPASSVLSKNSSLWIYKHQKDIVNEARAMYQTYLATQRG